VEEGDVIIQDKHEFKSDESSQLKESEGMSEHVGNELLSLNILAKSRNNNETLSFSTNEDKRGDERKASFLNAFDADKVNDTSLYEALPIIRKISLVNSKEPEMYHILRKGKTMKNE